ncbi:putative sphingosine N-acyltransferase-like protein [Podospora fimiseda]|uniref:Sphingosine N-acyltransferase-like protein n=1 Tax=Podospora fimiseda TaxID=252190 RepID=A0AAN6YRV3_9PEZI|nr:putative sphingosine N-acyltransferase-like protein [Podospora fimiseda]
MSAVDLNPRPGVNLTPKMPSTLGRRSKESKPSSSLLNRTWTIPLLLTTPFLLLYALNPTPSNPIHPFIFLSYKLPSSPQNGLYNKGPLDILFVIFYTIFLTFIRNFFMSEILLPSSRHFRISSPGKQLRFAENTYTALYIILFSGPIGIYLMYSTPGLWYFCIKGIYSSYPQQVHSGVFKTYYLIQAAFWLQQVVVMVLGLEARRKDFNQLIGHHFVTVLLIALSYRFHFGFLGLAVYLSHDISDFFLCVAKSLNYMESGLQGYAFGVCVLVWIYLRHWINGRILWSMLPGGEFETVGPEYKMDWEREMFKGPVANAVTFGLLGCLQGLNLFWLWCLGRAGYKFLFLGVAKDDRSGDEDEGEGEGEDVQVTGRVVKRRSGRVRC